MNVNPLAVVLLAIASSAATAWVTVTITAPGPEPERVDPVRRTVAIDDPADADPAVVRLRSDVLALQNTVDEIVRRLEDLASREASSRVPVGDFVTRDELERLIADRRTNRPAQDWQNEPDPELQQRIARAFEAVKKRAVDKHDAKAAELDARVDALTKELGLDRYQASEMRTMLSARDQANREILRLWQEGADDRTLGAAKEETRANFQTELQRVLSPAQLEQYRARRDGDAK